METQRFRNKLGHGRVPEEGPLKLPPWEEHGVRMCVPRETEEYLLLVVLLAMENKMLQISWQRSTTAVCNAKMQDSSRRSPIGSKYGKRETASLPWRRRASVSTPLAAP